jgi:hypothetical protein
MTEEINEEFKKVIRDFIGDLKQTFPEYQPLISKWWKDKSKFADIENEEDRNQAFKKAEDNSLKFLFGFCKKKLPPRFFDILYQNEDMFKEDSAVDTEFLPHIHFKDLWVFDITQKTRDIIWKYLQLILFSIVGTLDNKEVFGDTAKLFESINQDDFKSKLEETLSKMQGLFENMGSSGESATEGATNAVPNIPNANDIHDHISGMLDGKLGKLAKEIAEETAADLNMDMDNVTDMNGVFSKLIKNPTKLMGLVKNVGDKIDGKIKSGELKESELISEATDIMNKMKNMPGMGDIQSMLSKMGMNPGGGKLNMNAMESNLNQKLKTAKTKERMKAKAEENRLNREKMSQENVVHENLANPSLDEKLISLFNTEEKAERTPRGAVPKKKKKGKK